MYVLPNRRTLTGPNKKNYIYIYFVIKSKNKEEAVKDCVTYNSSFPLRVQHAAKSLLSEEEGVLEKGIHEGSIIPILKHTNLEKKNPPQQHNKKSNVSDISKLTVIVDEVFSLCLKDNGLKICRFMQIVTHSRYQLNVFSHLHTHFHSKLTPEGQVASSWMKLLWVSSPYRLAW